MDPRQPVMTIGPFWTPEVWTKDPDALVAEARAELFEDRVEVEHGALDTDDKAISGVPGDQNESEQLITPAPAGRAATWASNLQEMRRTAPAVYGEGEAPPAP